MKTLDEVSKRKRTPRVELKVASLKEWIHMWKEYFKNQLGKSPKVTDKPTMKIIKNQLDIKLGQFTQEELNVARIKIKNRKAGRLDEIPPEVWKTRKFSDLRLWYCNAVYIQNAIERWTKGCILPFPQKNDIGNAKNYQGITHTSIVAKIYNALLFNHIKPEIEKILRENQNGFMRNWSTTSQILIICQVIGVCSKNFKAKL